MSSIERKPGWIWGWGLRGGIWGEKVGIPLPFAVFPGKVPEMGLGQRLGKAARLTCTCPSPCRAEQHDWAPGPGRGPRQLPQHPSSHVQEMKTLSVVLIEGIVSVHTHKGSKVTRVISVSPWNWGMVGVGWARSWEKAILCPGYEPARGRKQGSMHLLIIRCLRWKSLNFGGLNCKWLL